VDKRALLVVIAGSSVLLYDNAQPLVPVLLTQLSLGTQATVAEFVTNVHDASILYVLATSALFTVQIEHRAKDNKQRTWRLVLRSSFALPAFTDTDLLADVRGQALYVAAVVHRKLYVFSLLRDPAEPRWAKTVVNELVPNNLTQTCVNPLVLVVSGQWPVWLCHFTMSRTPPSRVGNRYLVADIWPGHASGHRPRIASRFPTLPPSCSRCCARPPARSTNGFAAVPHTDMLVNVGYAIHSPLTLYRLKNYASNPDKKIALVPLSTVTATPGRAPIAAQPIVNRRGKAVAILSSKAPIQLIAIA